MSNSKLAKDQRLSLLRQVARRLDKLDDARLVEIEHQTRAAAILSGDQVAAAVPAARAGRRDFLRQVLLYTSAGLAVGGAAAIGKERWDAAQAANEVAAVAVDNLQAQVHDQAAQMTLLEQSLTVARSALNDLRPQLSSALTENAALQNNLLDKQKEADGLRGELSDAEADIAALKQLLGMYHNLDGVGLDAALVNGLAAVASAFAGALGIVPLVVDGLRLARSLFDALEAQLPAFRAAVAWLRGRFEALGESIAAVEAAAGQAVHSLDPVANRLSQLIDYILDHLPFGMGRSIKSALIALDDLYHSLPDLIAGANEQVVTVLGALFADDGNGLGPSLLKPVRELAFNPAEQLAARLQALYDSYVSNLHDPAVGALDQRAAIRNQIAEFRAANQIK